MILFQTAVSNCEPCGKKTETPESTGTKQEQAQAVSVGETSGKFKLLRVSGVEGKKQATVMFKTAYQL